MKESVPQPFFSEEERLLLILSHDPNYLKEGKFGSQPFSSISKSTFNLYNHYLLRISVFSNTYSGSVMLQLQMTVVNFPEHISVLGV